MAEEIQRSRGPPTSPKENVMTPAGLAPAPVAVFTCSREARRLIESGLKAAHRSLSGPCEVETSMFACDRAARWIPDFAHAHDQLFNCRRLPQV